MLQCLRVLKDNGTLVQKPLKSTFDGLKPAEDLESLLFTCEVTKTSFRVLDLIQTSKEMDAFWIPPEKLLSCWNINSAQRTDVEEERALKTNFGTRIPLQVLHNKVI
ncbi:hypothetical protein NPIL_27411 [Nephila pilipes]|uniref:Uncharacterized protein n=1 Tax=Nephila pilipes TaxID=299642 RepID=A0A8X6P3Y5_NEPPI|nr:hypothetical protein NPIL_27411 [Nephila pilipes]